MNQRICVVGTSYVGLSLAVLLARRNDVVAYDIDEQRVERLRRGESPNVDPDIDGFLQGGGLSLRATTDPAEAVGPRALRLRSQRL